MNVFLRLIFDFLRHLIFEELIPVDLIRTQGSSDWKRAVTAAYNGDSGLTEDEAKVAFLKYIYKWPTFGSAFFEVKVKDILKNHH